MRFKHLPIIAFDTETTGLAPFDGDKIIEVGAVKLTLDERGEVIAREDFSQLINPGIPIPRKVTEITGIRDAQVENQPPFAAIAHELHRFMGQGIAVAHNFPFDLAFLDQEFRAAGLAWPEPFAEVDTVDVSMRMFPEANSHKLADLAARCEVSLENAHRATDDAAACGYAFAKLLRRANLADDLQALLDWANAIGRPPSDAPLVSDEDERLVFAEGPHAGRPIAEHPIHLHWMTKARERAPDGWRWRYSESTRRWITRWLAIRGAGRMQNPIKISGPADWAIDSCIAV